MMQQGTGVGDPSRSALSPNLSGHLLNDLEGSVRVKLRRTEGLKTITEVQARLARAGQGLVPETGALCQIPSST